MTLDHHPHHEPHETGHRWLDIGIALCALIVSVASVAVTMIHGRTMERMADANARLVDANSWPFVDYSTDYTGADSPAPEIRMIVSNEGVGPAKIEAMSLEWQGVAYPDGLKFLEACCGYHPAAGDQTQLNSVAGRVLRAGDRADFIVLGHSDADADAFQRLRAARVSPDLKINLCYCSVFDECWNGDVTSGSLKPAEVPECKAPAVPYTVPK